MNTNLVLTLLVVTMAVACTSTSDVNIIEKRDPLPADTRVYVWLDGNPPAELVTAAGGKHYRGSGPADMVKIAEANLRKGAEVSWETLLKRGEAKARELGGNGLIIRWKSGMSVTAPRVAVTVFHTGPAPKK